METKRRAEASCLLALQRYLRPFALGSGVDFKVIIRIDPFQKQLLNCLATRGLLGETQVTPQLDRSEFVRSRLG